MRGVESEPIKQGVQNGKALETLILATVRHIGIWQRDGPLRAVAVGIHDELLH